MPRTTRLILEAQRSVTWDQPRGVSQITCRGEKYYLANGGEEAGMKSKPFKVPVQSYGKTVFWTFSKPPSLQTPASYGIEAKGPHRRWFDDKAGTTAAGAAAGASRRVPSATAARSCRPTW